MHVIQKVQALRRQGDDEYDWRNDAHGEAPEKQLLCELGQSRRSTLSRPTDLRHRRSWMFSIKSASYERTLSAKSQWNLVSDVLRLDSDYHSWVVRLVVRVLFSVIFH